MIEGDVSGKKMNTGRKVSIYKWKCGGHWRIEHFYSAIFSLLTVARKRNVCLCVLV